MMDIGRKEGIQQGLQQGIHGTITTLRSIGWIDDVIMEKLVEVYGTNIE